MFQEILLKESDENIYKSLLRMMRSKISHHQGVATEWNNDEVLLVLFNQTTKTVNTQQVESLWKAMAYAFLLDEDEIGYERRQLFVSLRKSFLRDVGLTIKLDKVHLISLAQEQPWCQEVLIALTRRHLLETRSSDPFADKKFSYEWIDPSLRNPNFFKIIHFYIQCNSLPVEDIVLIGKQNQTIVKFIMQSFRNCHDIFSISAQFAIHYPEFRKEIATDWADILNTFPIDVEQRSKIESLVKNQLANYIEFEKIKVKEQQNFFYTAGGFSTLAISSGLGWYLRNYLMAKCTSGTSLSLIANASYIVGNTAPLTLPVIACVGFHILFKQGRSQKKLEKSTDIKHLHQGMNYF